MEVDWKPFLLDASASKEAQPIENYAEKRFGAGWREMYSRLQNEGSRDGAPFADWKWRCNTVKALQLVEFAKNHGVDSTKSKETLFDALYEKGEDVSSVDVLVMIGKERLGLESEEAAMRQYLERDEGAKEVHDQIAHGVGKYGIRGVPYFVIQRKGTSQKPYGVSGAQLPETFVEVFEEFNE